MPTGSILAYSVPDGADVFVDGIPLPTRFGPARTPTLIPEVPAGTHNVTFRLPGYYDEIKTVDVSQGGWSTVYAIFARQHLNIKKTNNNQINKIRQPNQ